MTNDHTHIPDPEPAAPIPPLTDEQVTDLARDIVTNQVFVALDDDAIRCAFPIVSLIPAMPPNAAFPYEYMDKAGPRSVNGYPMFFSCRLLPVENVDRLRDECIRLHTAMTEALR